MPKFLTAFFASVMHLFNKPAAAALEDFESKLSPDIIKLATDACKTVPAALSGTAARDAAKAQLKLDLAALKNDAVSFAEYELNFLIELVYLPLKGSASL